MLKSYLVTVEIEIGDSDPTMALERVKRIPFGNNDCDFRIVGMKEGEFLPGQGLGALPHIRDNQNEGDVVVRVVGGQ
jgi:hypothetical protein